MAIFTDVQFGGLQSISASRADQFSFMEGAVPILGIKSDRLIGLWPGLPAAWMRGRVCSLLIALGFAVVLEVALLTSVVWPLWLGRNTVAVVWFCVVVYWLIGALPFFVRGTLGSRDLNFGNRQRLDLFRQAQREYLRGDWFQAEQRLHGLLAADETDVVVQLMLASLYRRIDRPERAERHLDLVAQYDQPGKWQWEVSQQRRQLRNSRPPKTDASPASDKAHRAASRSGAA